MALSRNFFWGFQVTPGRVVGSVNTMRQNAAERRSREKLARGVPTDAPICEKHRENLGRMSRAGQDGGPRNPPGQTFPHPSSSNIHTSTLLLPQCKLCCLTENNLLSYDIPDNFDMCHCATNILSSSCVYCAIGKLNCELKAAIATRTRQDFNSHDFLACECGSHVMLPLDIGEVVRKCIGCGGAVTAPFRNFAGDKVTFRHKSMDVARIEPSTAAEKRVELFRPPLSLSGVELSAVAVESVSMAPDVMMSGVDDELSRRDARSALGWGSVQTIDPRCLEKKRVETLEWPTNKRQGNSTNTASSVEEPIRIEPHSDMASSNQPPNRESSKQHGDQHPRRKPVKTAQRKQKLKQPLQPKQPPVPRSRRDHLHELGQRAGLMGLADVTRVMSSFRFTDSEIGRVYEFVTGHGLQEIQGGDLVGAIEKALGKEIEG